MGRKNWDRKKIFWPRGQNVFDKNFEGKMFGTKGQYNDKIIWDKIDKNLGQNPCNNT
jgi:hypothetical protein